MLLIGLGARAPAPMPYRPLLPMPVVQEVTSPLGVTERQFLLCFHARLRPWGASLKLEVGPRWSGGLWKFNEIKSKTVGAYA